jgi:hypothetical protein
MALLLAARNRLMIKTEAVADASAVALPALPEAPR